ncbi:LacI family DNA-binding transcriptional regulator [uncultured Pseudokineococcus sp.]|uniref:LacI family DNA-binding transcriptional regulator n=1 Tax=uncultured Pseudokineococcus sp. TaxID=1642928 RepID=UPI002604FE72|nr:LacI family DNA-binding transcriptional regulator [uncultured Pseudokineococcus sp.]
MASSARPTIADVARAAGVSRGAVSFALNGRPGVSESTRARILRVAEEMRWQPDHRARSMRGRRVGAVGLVLHRSADTIADDPFFASLIAGVESVVSRQAWSLVLDVVADDEEERAAYERLARERRVDGVLVTDLRVDDPRIGWLVDLRLPAVTLQRPSAPSPFPAVRADDAGGVRAVVRHLVELGHRRVAHVAGPADLEHGLRRRRALEDELAASGLEPVAVVETDFTAAAGARATAQLLDLAEPPTAVVHASDPMALAGIGVAAARGLRLPEDLSVTGIDDVELAAHVHPPLTTVRTDSRRWGALAATALVDLLARTGDPDGPAPLPPGDERHDVLLPPVELVVRGSTAPPPAPAA